MILGREVGGYVRYACIIFHIFLRHRMMCLFTPHSDHFNQHDGIYIYI